MQRIHLHCKECKKYARIRVPYKCKEGTVEKEAEKQSFKYDPKDDCWRCFDCISSTDKQSVKVVVDEKLTVDEKVVDESSTEDNYGDEYKEYKEKD